MDRTESMTPTAAPRYTVLPVPFTRVRVVTGSKAHEVTRGQILGVAEVRQYGAEYSHQVDLVLVTVRGRKVFTVRHLNRLSDDTFSAHKGDPTKKVTFQIAPSDSLITGTCRVRPRPVPAPV
jgi:hypothetical protein